MMTRDTKNSPHRNDATRGVSRLVEHLFRHQSARLVARLTAIFGPAQLEMAEEVVQEALIAAMQRWPFHGIPENPEAWLARVARNRALDRVRRRSLFQTKLPQVQSQLEELDRFGVPATGFRGEVDEDQLRMIFMCCHPALPRTSQVVLTLKTVGGLGRDELARAFLTRPATIAQRLVRAKKRVREAALDFEMPVGAELTARLESVHDVLYLIFNEGYGAHLGKELVRADLCQEAIRLTRILVAHPDAATAPGKALLALMLLLASRLKARTDRDGNVILLSQQDRSLWERELIREGFHWFEASMEGQVETRFHLEAAIAAVHARAGSYDRTEWPQILGLYDSLAALSPSPVVELNRAVALSFVQGPQAALERLQELKQQTFARELDSYYLYPATLATLHQQLGSLEVAASFYRRALELPCSEPEKRFLKSRLRSLNAK